MTASAEAKSTGSHAHLKRYSYAEPLTGHWGGNSVGLRGFAPLLLAGKRALGDCDAQVRPEVQFQERPEDAARFARRAYRHAIIF